jgi:hypothetical protein
MSTSKNFVLDIDNTLIHTHDEIEDFTMLNIYDDDEKIKYRRNLYSMKIIDASPNVACGSGNADIYAGQYRPYLRHFLDYLDENDYKIVIWSAGQKKYVDKMVELMYPFKEKQPLLVYNYDDCNTEDGDDDLKKPLDKLYKDKRLKGLFNEKNTFVLDDRSDTFSLNPSNGIEIPVFESKLTVEEIADHDDYELIKLMCWLETKEVKNCEDVRKLRKDKIFKKDLKEYNRQIIRERSEE